MGDHTTDDATHRTDAKLGAETGVDLGTNILGYTEFAGAAWASAETIERLAEGER